MDTCYRIGVMDALLFAITLEVLLLQMRILDTTTQRKFPNHSIKSKRENQLRDKLTRNRQFIKDIFLRTLLELVNYGEYSTLQKGTKMLQKKSTLLITLRSRYEELKCSLENIATQLQKTQKQWKRDLNDSDLKVALLRDSIKDRVSNARLQHVYADRWLSARKEALELRHETTFAPAPKLGHEHCVHNELLRAYELQIQEREELLQYWLSRYSRDIVTIETRLQEQCEKLRIAVARRVELEKLFTLHEGEMRSWLTFKRERAARLAREARLRAAATRVQAWWRGVMVRRALGTFRYLRNVKKTPLKPKKK